MLAYEYVEDGHPSVFCDYCLPLFPAAARACAPWIATPGDVGMSMAQLAEVAMAGAQL